MPLNDNADLPGTHIADDTGKISAQTVAEGHGVASFEPQDLGVDGIFSREDCERTGERIRGEKKSGHGTSTPATFEFDTSIL